MRARTLVAALGTRNIARASTPLFFGGFLRSPFGTTAAAAAAATTQRASVAMPVSTEAATTTAAKTPAHPIAAVAQLRSTSDKFRNLLDVAHCAGLARSRGASMLFLPECFGFMGESAEQTLREAEDPSRLEAAGGGGPGGELAAALEAAVRGAAAGTAPGGTTGVPSPPVDSLLDGLRTIARASGLWISGGGVHVSGAPPEDGSKEGRPRVYNTHVVLDADGALRASYQKIHLFDVSIPGKVDLRESRTTAPGTRLVVCDSPVGRLGVTTCYDMRFPEVYTELVGTMGAQVLLLPSAFTVPTGAAHWHTLLRGEWANKPQTVALPR